MLLILLSSDWIEHNSVQPQLALLLLCHFCCLKCNTPLQGCFWSSVKLGKAHHICVLFCFSLLSLGKTCCINANAASFYSHSMRGFVNYYSKCQKTVNKVDVDTPKIQDGKKTGRFKHQSWFLTFGVLRCTRLNVINVFVVQQPSATSLKQSVKDRLGPLLSANSEPSQDSSVASQVCDGVEAELFHVHLSISAVGVYKHYVFSPPAESFQSVSEGPSGFLCQTSSSCWKSKHSLTVKDYWFPFWIRPHSNCVIVIF